MKLASYKATRPGLPGVFNRLVRWWLHGAYSHCELVFSDGMAFSCSKMDKGPRFKQIEFDPEHWDFVSVPTRYAESEVRAHAEAIVAERDPKARVRYSLLLLAAFVLPPLYRWVGDCDEVCGTAVALALGIPGHRAFDPIELHDYLSHQASE